MDNIVKDNAMRQIKFSVPGQPFGKQRPKFSRAGQYVKTYSPDETVSYENLVKLMYQQTAKGRMFKDEDMLDVRVIAYYEIPQSTMTHQGFPHIRFQSGPAVYCAPVPPSPLCQGHS